MKKLRHFCKNMRMNWSDTRKKWIIKEMNWKLSGQAMNQVVTVLGLKFQHGCLGHSLPCHIAFLGLPSNFMATSLACHIKFLRQLLNNPMHLCRY